MAYCDFEFYKNEYYGTAIAEADFMRYASRASDRLDSITFDRLIDQELDERTDTKVKKATCAIADVLYNIEKASTYEIGEDGLPKGKAVASISAGSESISFVNTATTAETVAGDKSAQDRLIYQSAQDYLSGTGLLYAGV